MRRAWILCCAALCGLPLSVTADAVVYRCVGKHGLVYQDQPCAGAKDSQNRVLVTGTVAQPPLAASPPDNVSGDRSLSEWVARTSQENRVREAEHHVRALEQRNRAEEAEFAAMLADVEQKKQDALAGAADVPPVYLLEASQAELKQNYVEKAQQNQLELDLARKALEAQRE